ncbi:MAG: hypothetical protein ACJA09_001306 [Alcanivorax sp.]|jgi:hypothetical protein
MNTEVDPEQPVVRLPLPWAAAVMVMLILPLTFYLGNWNIPLWVSFIVWAEYFVLGAKPSSWKIILPSVAFGVAGGAFWCLSATYVASMLAPYVEPPHVLYIAFAITNFIWVPLIVYGTNWTQTFREGTLAVFNGLTLQLAVYFTGSIPYAAELESNYSLILASLFWTLILAWFGWFLGWFNIFLTFPSKKLLSD